MNWNVDFCDRKEKVSGARTIILTYVKIGQRLPGVSVQIERNEYINHSIYFIKFNITKGSSKKMEVIIVCEQSGYLYLYIDKKASNIKSNTDNPDIERKHSF